MFDLTCEGLTPALAVAMGQLENAFRRLSNLVGSMDQAALDYRGPDGTQNSTAMLVNHLALTDLEYLSQIVGRPVAPDLAAELGPYEDDQGRIPALTGLSAAEVLGRHRRALDQVQAYLLTRDDAEAERAVQVPWWPQPATVRYVLWHMAAHSMHHQGQIARLRAQAARG